MPASDTVITLDRGPYRMRSQIGRSVYGTVWRAVAPDGRDVAVKLVNEERMAQAEPGLRERWVACACNEIAFLRTLAPWDNRHLVRLVDSGWHAGLPVLVLELLPTDLARHLAQCRAAGAPPSFAQALDWAGQLNQALGKVHQYGWRYLDLKPANILLDPATGTLRLADFGTNRRLTATEAHSYAGTAQWQAPEQFIPAPDGGYATSHRSDYFALGALLYFIVTGVPLHWSSACGQAYREHLADGARHLLAAHGGAVPALPTLGEVQRFAAAVPAGSRDAALALLRALLAAEPSARPPHAVAISRLLAAAGSGLALTHVERTCALTEAA
ncbi:protein kinase domain-containing protein [Pseudoduganella chitinolytica]|uniref:Protein kinase n=1 Tax=Pseudoduganella chitinolytica TaxID=34070 RepID=A0ABY8BKT3_9BURK|nr:protein kinase [Pseudoduganella chitinolytica]WEF34984.1 protein kinase [Pseudoduganella chitinolytica]